MAHALRDAVFEAVNDLPARERSALIAVELEDLGYPEIASRDSLVATDVGNIIRRAYPNSGLFQGFRVTSASRNFKRTRACAFDSFDGPRRWATARA